MRVCACERLCLGLCKGKKLKKSENTMEVGGWVQVTLGFLCVENQSSQNSSKPVQIFWSSIPLCILSVYTLLKVVSYYDLSVLSKSVMVSKKKSVDGGWVGVWVG